MKYGDKLLSIKVSKQLLTSGQDFTDYIAREFVNKIKKMKGVKVFLNGSVTMTDQDGDCFVRNMVVAYLKIKVYKKPRFIK